MSLEWVENEPMTDRMTPDMSDVDSAGTATAYVERMKALESRARVHKERSYEPLALVPGARVLDVGCGPGTDLPWLADRVGPGGFVVGVDRSRQLLEAARARIEERGGITLVQGDARRLPCPSASFDGCRAERVFQHLDDPERSLAEMIRVTRPGGRIVVVDADFETIVIDAEDAELSQAVVSRRASAPPNGRVGRRLRRMMLEAGLEEVGVEGVVFGWTDAELALGGFDLLAIADDLAAGGAFAAERVERWKAELVERGRQGTFFLASGGFIAWGTNPR